MKDALKQTMFSKSVAGQNTTHQKNKEIKPMKAQKKSTINQASMKYNCINYDKNKWGKFHLQKRTVFKPGWENQSS